MQQYYLGLLGAYLLGLVSGILLALPFILLRRWTVPIERLTEMTAKRDTLEARNLELSAQIDYFREQLRELLTLS